MPRKSAQESVVVTSSNATLKLLAKDDAGITKAQAENPMKRLLSL
jgi:hypothetical protein